MRLIESEEFVYKTVKAYQSSTPANMNMNDLMTQKDKSNVQIEKERQQKRV